MNLEILSPGKQVFKGEVDGIQLPGTEGSFEILNNHAALIASLDKGQLRYKINDKSILVDINGGFVEVLNNNVTVLIDNSANENKDVTIES